MKLHVEWSTPIPLRSGARKGLMYTIDLEKLPDVPGVYILGRQYGSGFEALYVGRANVIRRRLRGQLNNLRLMQHIRSARSGKRIVLAGIVITKPGQGIEKVLPLVEKALIRHFLSEGHDLVNIQGTRRRQHEVTSSGRHPKRYIPSPMYLER